MIIFTKTYSGIIASVQEHLWFSYGIFWQQILLSLLSYLSLGYLSLLLPTGFLLIYMRVLWCLIKTFTLHHDVDETWLGAISSYKMYFIYLIRGTSSSIFSARISWYAFCNKNLKLLLELPPLQVSSPNENTKPFSRL